MSIVGAADDDLLQRGANHWRDGHDVGRDFGCPITLVPREQVSGEREAEDEQQQSDAEPKIHFARGFVAPSMITCMRCRTRRMFMAWAVK